MEVAITSEASGQFWSIGVWDITTGSQLMAYKSGGVIASHSLCLVGSDYIVGAELTKPLLHVWPINSAEPSHDLRTVCPGIVGALAVSPDGKYVVAGVAEKIHVWQLEAGRLLCVATRHFQPVTCIRFMEDGSHFASAGQDGMVLVWYLGDLVAQDGVRYDPVHTFQSHYLPVKDVFVGNGGSKSRIVSVSVDGTCRVYDFSSGKLLLSLILDGMNLTAVTADVLESTLFLGSNCGDILSIDLQDRPRHVEHHVSEKERESVFKGHTKAVTALSSSQNAIELLSGSADETVRLWHIESKQCLRTIQHKGAVNNAFISFIPPQIFAEKLKPSVVMHRLLRVTDVDNENLTVNLATNVNEKAFEPFSLSLEDGSFDLVPSYSAAGEADNTEVARGVEDLKKENLALFKYATEKIFQEFSNDESTGGQQSLVDISLCVENVKQGKPNITPVRDHFKKKEKKKLRCK